MDTHTPYDVEREQTQQCLDRFDYSNQPLEQLATKFPEDSYSHERLLPGGRVYQTAKQWEDTEYGVGTAVVNAQYDASVKKADERVGNIIELLREQEILDETLLFVLSDHGESLTEHDILYDHHGLYDVSVRVPFIIRPPGGCDRSSSEDFVQITDIAPTVASYTALSEFASVDGVSLRPAIDSAESIDRSQILADEANTQRRRMIRTTDEKLTYRIDDKKLCSYCEIEHAGPKEYYRLDEDPAEQTNLADEFQDRVKKFQEIAEKAADTFSGRAPDPGDMSIDYEDDEAEIRDRLEALGYR